MISPVAANLFASNLYPTPINASLQQNAVYISASAFNVDQGDLKVDFKATEKDNISYRFTSAYQNNPTDQFSGTVGATPTPLRQFTTLLATGPA